VLWRRPAQRIFRERLSRLAAEGSWRTVLEALEMRTEVRDRAPHRGSVAASAGAQASS